MPLGVVFWIIMLLWALFWGFGRTPQGEPYWISYNSVLIFVLLGILGWGVFGRAIQ